MKKIMISLCAFALVAFSFSGCQVGQFAKFTSSDRLYQIQVGDSYETVVSTLGCEPYNLMSKQADGYDIYVYLYKIVEREINPARINDRGSESAGREVYKDKEEIVYLVFKDNKLESAITGLGRKDSPRLVMMNNTLYEVSVNAKGDYVMTPTEMKVEKKEEPQVFKKKKRAQM